MTLPLDDQGSPGEVLKDIANKLDIANSEIPGGSPAPDPYTLDDQGAPIEVLKDIANKLDTQNEELAALTPGALGAASAADLTAHTGLTTTAHGGIVAATDPVFAAVSSLQTTAATIEELTSQAVIYNAVISAAYSFGLFIAPFPCRIVWAALTTWSGGVTASDSDYWTVNIRRCHNNGTPDVFVSKSTKVTGGEAITQRTPWLFDTAAWDTSKATLAYGDGVDFQFAKTLSPASISNPILAIRYQPL